MLPVPAHMLELNRNMAGPRLRGGDAGMRRLRAGGSRGAVGPSPTGASAAAAAAAVAVAT